MGRKLKKGSPAWARYKNRKRLARQGLIYEPNHDYERFLERLEDAGREFIVAPKNFSLQDNTGGVIEYFNDVMKSIVDQKMLVMDMSAVTCTDLSTISVVISMMMDRREEESQIRKYVKVYIPPANTEPGMLFRKAQFHETVTSKGIADHTFFLSRRSTKVNAKFIKDILTYSEKFLGKDSVQNLSPILVEIISNTNNHANPESSAEEDRVPWFVSIMEDDLNGKMYFSVVDLGIGIFESLKRKGLAVENHVFDDVIKDMYLNSQSKFLSENIPKGVDSATGLFYRGQGLQTVHALVNDRSYNKFTIVTNRARVDMKRAQRVMRDSADSMNGTVYYWEMRKNG